MTKQSFIFIYSMKVLLVIGLFIYGMADCLAQGTFAGGFASLIGKTYQNPAELKELAGFTDRGGSMLSLLDDEELFLAVWFIKGSVIVAVFEKIYEDDTREILDVLEIKNVTKIQELKLGDCRDGDESNSRLVALVNTNKNEYWKALKAWYFNFETRKLETFLPARVTCLGMVD
jgi:hypothetical protein